MTYSYDRRVALGPQTGSYEVTAEQLCRALWGVGAGDLNRGTYPGTKIPLRKVSPNTPITIIERGPQAVIQDRDGGWIADRFGPVLGVREWKRDLKELRRTGVVSLPSPS